MGFLAIKMSSPQSCMEEIFLNRKIVLHTFYKGQKDTFCMGQKDTIYKEQKDTFYKGQKDTFYKGQKDTLKTLS